jgi:hypothetical protein
MKFVIDLSKGILGEPDDIALWRDILGRRSMRRACKKAKRILIVSGGHGTEVEILVQIHGIDIVKKIYFNDIFICFTNAIKAKYPDINILLGDFLKLGFNMKFGVIVGNPPFQKSDKTGRDDDNLWPLFLEKAHEIVEENGYVGFVSPSSWASLGANHKTPGSKIRKKFFDTKQVEYVDFTAGKYFNVGSTFSSYVVKNAAPDPSVLTDFVFADKAITAKFSDYVCVPLNYSNSEFGDIIKSFRSKTPYDITINDPYHTQRASMKNKLAIGEFAEEQSQNHPYRSYHTNAQTHRWSKYKNNFHNQWKAVFSYSGTWAVEVTNDCSLTDASMCVLCDTEQEALSVQSVLASKPITFLIDKVYRWSGYYSGAFMHMIPALPKNKIYTDDEVYDLLFTKSQADLIRSLVK